MLITQIKCIHKMKPETANFEESKNIKWTCKSKYIKVNLI